MALSNSQKSILGDYYMGRYNAYRTKNYLFDILPIMVKKKTFHIQNNNETCLKNNKRQLK